MALAEAVRGQHTLEYGFEQRVRNENWNNIFDFNESADDQRVQVRYRTRLWLNAGLTRTFAVNVGLNQETNQIVTPDRPFQFDEVIFESAYLDFKKLFVNGLSLRAGRQNITRGEGFVLFEGGAYDGSRAIYMNAAVLGYAWKKSQLELMAISNPRTDRYLPRIHDRHKTLTEWDEQALGAYYTGRNLPKTSIEAYYFFKKELNDPRPSTHPQYQPDRHVHTGGGRVAHEINNRWSATVEWAFQWGGERPRTPIRAWGGYGYLRRSLGEQRRHYVQGGYWAMSGDDPSTPNRIEGWDPLFSRWPKWSELYIYTQVMEKGAAYWTNTDMWQGELGLTPAKWIRGRCTYYRMGAYHRFPGSPRLYGAGGLRGDHVQARADMTFGRHWSGHALCERLFPGDFYSTLSGAWFLRFEVIYNWKGAAEF
jgi:hypothetical protein